MKSVVRFWIHEVRRGELAFELFRDFLGCFNGYHVWITRVEQRYAGCVAHGFLRGRNAPSEGARGGHEKARHNALSNAGQTPPLVSDIKPNRLAMLRQRRTSCVATGAITRKFLINVALPQDNG